MAYCEQVSQLLEAYSGIRACRGAGPDWAVRTCAAPERPVIATIPFVGKEYHRQQVKLLVYASAENLTGYDGYLDDDAYAANRHRHVFDASVAKGDAFFPHVHIKPMEDGALSTGAAYVYAHFADVDGLLPPAFFEKIAFGNVGKFSRRAEGDKRGNIDYAGNAKYLKENLDYIAADLRILHPDIILMPAAAYRALRVHVDAWKGGARVLPMYQINARTINTLIAKRYPRKPAGELSPTMRLWLDGLCYRIVGKTRENYPAVFSYLDEQIAKYLSNS